MADENTFFEEDGARASRQAELNPLLPEVAVRMREVFRELTAILTRYHGGDPQWLAPDRQGEADLCRDAPNDRSLARWDMNVAKTRAEYPREVYEADLPEVLAYLEGEGYSVSRREEVWNGEVQVTELSRPDGAVVRLNSVISARTGVHAVTFRVYSGCARVP